MNTLLTTSMAALSLLMIAGSQVAIADQKKAAANSYECVTDEGNGRTRSCAAGYMQKRADSNVYECFTDESGGRKLPCSFRIKR